MIPVSEQEPGERFGRPVNLQSWRGERWIEWSTLNKGQKQFENNQEPQGMRMKCWKNLLMKNVRKVFRESGEQAREYLLMEQMVNTDGMVSEGNSTCE
jgi:hypothetical protein